MRQTILFFWPNLHVYFFKLGIYQICDRLLTLIGDKNGEVQNLAVKCLGPLVGKVKGNIVEHIVDVLGNNMLSQSEQLRGISTMGESVFQVIL